MTLAKECKKFTFEGTQAFQVYIDPTTKKAPGFEFTLQPPANGQFAASDPQAEPITGPDIPTSPQIEVDDLGLGGCKSGIGITHSFAGEVLCGTCKAKFTKHPTKEDYN